MQNTATGYIRPHDQSTGNLAVLTHTLERLLVRHQPVLKAEGMDRQVENLKRWLKGNRKDFMVGGNISETGTAWLLDLCDSLKLAVEERHRLESEGGLPATKEQTEQNEELLDIVRRIEKIASVDSVCR